MADKKDEVGGVEMEGTTALTAAPMRWREHDGELWPNATPRLSYERRQPNGNAH
jgi:hypothetical protein